MSDPSPVGWAAVEPPPIPFFVLNELEVRALGDGGATCANEVGSWLAGTPELGLQAAAAALSDMVLMYAASTRARNGLMPVTVDLRLDFWSPPPAVGARLVGTGRVEPAAGDVLLVRGRIEHEATVVATAAVRAMLVPSGGGAAASGRVARVPIVEIVPAPSGVAGRAQAVDEILALPVSRLAGLDLVALGDGAIELTASPAHDLERTEGVVHGGAVPLLGSLASSAVLAASLAPGETVRRLDLAADYLRPTPLGSPLRVRARVVHRSRRVATTHAEVTTTDGKPTARVYETVAIDAPEG